MNLAPFRRQFRIEMLPAVLVFAGVLAVPIIEAMHGNWPGSHLEDSPAWREIRDGTLPARIEKDLSERSICARTIRPFYNEALYLLFERINPGAVLGKEQWLFTANWNASLDPDEYEDVGGRYIEAFASIADALKDLDSRLVFMIVPSKWAIHSDKLPAGARIPGRLVDRILPGLKERGVDVFPVEDVIRSLPYPQFRSTDTHWTNETALSVWESLVAWIRDSGIGLSGPVSAGRIERRGTYKMRSDLLRLLGFREGGPVEEQFMRDSRVIMPVFDDTGDSSPGMAGGEDMALIGTSFSYGFKGARFLSILGGHRWEDRAVGGGHPHVLLAKLAEEILFEGRHAPRLVVFEFPERYLIDMRRTMLPAMERLARDLSRVYAWSEAHVPWRLLQAAAITDLGETGEGGFSGLASANGGRLVLDLPPPACSAYLVTYTVEAETQAGYRTVLLGATEDGYDMEGARRFPCKPGRNSIRAIVESSSGKPFKQIVIRPFVGDGRFTISDIVIRRRK